MLVRMDEILKDAREKGYGVAAPNMDNIITVQWAFELAAEKKAPIIIDVCTWQDMKTLCDAVKEYARRYPQVPVALNLDHGRSIDEALYAIKCGCTSVMIDKARLSNEENADYLKKVIELVHPLDVSVEAEIGHVGGHGDGDYGRDCEESLTRVDDAVWYVKETGVDCLAVAVGTWHGLYGNYTPKLNFERIKELRAAVDVPLVVHGASYTGLEALGEAAKLGCCKFNIHAELTEDSYKYMNDNYLSNKDNMRYGVPHFFEAMDYFEKGWKESLGRYMDYLGSTGKVQ